MKKKRLLLSLPYGMSARNFLGSRIFSLLRKNFQVILATPLYQDPLFREEFTRQGVEVVDMPCPSVVPFRLFRYVLDIVEGIYFTHKTKIGTLRILAECLRQEKPSLYYSRLGLGFAILKTPGLFRSLKYLQIHFIGMPYYKKLLKQLRPDLVFQTHPLSIDEFPMALYAKKMGIPVAAMIHSWDNITAKSGIRVVTRNSPGRMLPVQYDHLLVWNEIQRDELIKYYGYSPDQISITGVPQFDFYSTHNTSDRASFFKKWNLDPDKKLIVFTAGSPILLPKQNEVIDIMSDCVTSGKLGYPAQLLIRTHPRTDMGYLKETPDVRIQYPGTGYITDRVTSGWRDSHNEQAEFVDTLRHADVVINVASTVCLDCAALDRPSICICFDGYKNNQYYKSIVKHYDYDHFLPVVRSGAVRMARSTDELIQFITAYIANPRLDDEGRSRLRTLECFKVDGCVADRVAGAIATLVCGKVDQHVIRAR